MHINLSRLIAAIEHWKSHRNPFSRSAVSEFVQNKKKKSNLILYYSVYYTLLYVLISNLTVFITTAKIDTLTNYFS